MAKIKRIYLYFVLFMVIYIEFGYQVVVANKIPGTMRMLILLALTISILLIEHKIKKTSFLCFVAITLYIFVNSLRDNNFSDYILLLIPIFVGFILATVLESTVLVKMYGNIMYFLSLYSLGIYCLNILMPSIIQKLPFLGNVYTYSAEIHDAIFAVAITNSENIRNYGIAWEPGAFSLLVCVALLFETTFYKRISYKRMMIFVLAIITTFSTTGYFAMIGILYASFFYKRKLTRKEKCIFLLIIMAIVIFFIFLPHQIKQLVFSKLNGLFSGGTIEVAYTTKSRINAIKYPAEAFLSSPFIGVGYEKFIIVNRVLCDSVATNTIINWYAVLGAVLGLPCCIGLFNCLRKIMRKINAPKINFLILCLSMILLLSTESLLRISLVYIFVFWGFQEKSITKLDLIE